MILTSAIVILNEVKDLYALKWRLVLAWGISPGKAEPTPLYLHPPDQPAPPGGGTIDPESPHPLTGWEGQVDQQTTYRAVMCPHVTAS